MFCQQLTYVVMSRTVWNHLSRLWDKSHHFQREDRSQKEEENRLLRNKDVFVLIFLRREGKMDTMSKRETVSVSLTRGSVQLIDRISSTATDPALLLRLAAPFSAWGKCSVTKSADLDHRLPFIICQFDGLSDNRSLSLRWRYPALRTWLGVPLLE